MNRKHLSLLALILALVLTCAPLSALAESYSSAALTLKNPSITYGDQSCTAEISLTLDGGVDAENGVGRLLLSLMGGDQTALSGGANWDGESIIAGLDGMTKSVKLPLSVLTDTLEPGLSDMQENFTALEPQINALVEAFTALMDYVPSQEFIAQAGDLAVKTMNIEHAPDTSFEYDDETTLVGDCYTFSTTFTDIFKLISDIRALDPELDTLVNNLIDAANALTAAVSEEIDASISVNLEAALSGYVLITDNGDIVYSYDMKNIEDDALHSSYQLVMFNNENDRHFNIYSEVSGEDTPTYYMIADATIPKDSGDVTVSFYMDNIDEIGVDEGHGSQLLFATNKAARSTSLSFTYFEDYLYEDEMYEDTVGLTLTYLAGDAVTDETGTTYPGKLVLELSQNDETTTIGLETELRLYVSDQAFAASDDVVDLSDPDSDDVDALTSEFFDVYNSAAAIIAAAPGMADLLSFLGL